MNPRILHHKVVTVPHTSIISESEVSITVVCVLYSPRYSAVWIKDCSISMSVIKVTTMKLNTMVLHASIFIWNWSIHCPSLSAMFNSSHSSMNQQLFEKHLCNQGSDYKKYGWFPLCKGSHYVQPPNQRLCQQRWMKNKGEHW